MNDHPVLSVSGIVKTYGAVRALGGVELSVHGGEVVGLVGDNGAGKSTLVKVASGVIAPDEGEIWFEGELVRFRGPADATVLGIAVIYQDLALCDNLDVVANLFLGRELRPRSQGGFLDEETMESTAGRLLAELNVGAIRDLHASAGSLSGGQRQTIAIARALLGEPRLVMLDEPTAALGVAQSERVLKMVRRLAERGHAVLMISHNIADVFAVSDRIVVLRLGRVVADLVTSATTPDAVVSAITGAATIVGSGSRTA